MKAALLESLLNDDENSALDFKLGQYAFVGATDDAKSELMKDILAFANTGRQMDAYILIGVDDVRGGRSIISGIADHLDDHAIQQFVNYKTNRPITFSYEVVPIDGKQIGAIKIPVQNRPFYLKQDYGKLRAKTVYIRRGSSTGEASPDEIALMGVADSAIVETTPSLELSLANLGGMQRLEGDPILVSRVLNYDLEKLSRRLPANSWDLRTVNEEYEYEMAEYLRDMDLLNPLGFHLRNTGTVLAGGTRLEATITSVKDLVVVDSYDLPSEPSSGEFIHAFRYTPTNFASRDDPELCVQKLPGGFKIAYRFGNVQPKAEVWSNGSFYIGAIQPCEVLIQAVVFADNLPNPFQTELKIIINTTHGELNYDKLKVR